MFCFVCFLVSFSLIAVSAFLHRWERDSLTKHPFSIHAVASAYFERDYERAEKSKEDDCGSDVLKGLGVGGEEKNEENKNVWEEKRKSRVTIGKEKRSGDEDEKNGGSFDQCS